MRASGWRRAPRGRRAPRAVRSGGGARARRHPRRGVPTRWRCVCSRCPPPTRATSSREIPGAPALTGDRGRTPIDHDALVAFLLALAGADGLAARLGDELDELECNPVLATGDAAVALDARLVLRTMPGNARASAELGPTVTDFTRLFAPRAVAVAGASSRGGGFGNRALAAYRAFGWDEHLFALHPTATAIDGVPAVAGIAELDRAHRLPAGGGTRRAVRAARARHCWARPVRARDQRRIRGGGTGRVGARS